MVGCRSSIPSRSSVPTARSPAACRATRRGPQQLEMAEAVARAIESTVAPDGRGGDRRRQELRLPRAGDPGGGRVEEEGRRLDAHDQPPGAIAPEGPSVPPRGDAAGVHGGAGQGAVELHQPPPARRRLGPGGGDVPEARGVRPARRRSASGPAGPATGAGPTSTSAPCRASGTPSPARTATAWGRTARATRSASTSRPGGGCGRPTSWSSTTPCS